MRRIIRLISLFFVLCACDPSNEANLENEQRNNSDFVINGSPQFIKNYELIKCVAPIFSSDSNLDTFSTMLYDIKRNGDHIVYADYDNYEFAWIALYSENDCNSPQYGAYRIGEVKSIESIDRLMPAINADADLVMNYIRNQFEGNQTTFVSVSTNFESVSKLHDLIFFSGLLNGFPVLLSTIDDNAVVAIIDSPQENRALSLVQSLLDVNAELCRLSSECQKVKGAVTVASERQRSFLIDEINYPETKQSN